VRTEISGTPSRPADDPAPGSREDIDAAALLGHRLQAEIGAVMVDIGAAPALMVPRGGRRIDILVVLDRAIRASAAAKRKAELRHGRPALAEPAGAGQEQRKEKKGLIPHRQFSPPG
jgi:hypothetical protein